MLDHNWTPMECVLRWTKTASNGRNYWMEQYRCGECGLTKTMLANRVGRSTPKCDGLRMHLITTPDRRED